MIRPILRWPDARLRTPCTPVESVTDDVRAIWDDMIDTMEAMPGLGLGANQIGVMQALAVVDASDERGRAVRMANPRIIDAAPELKKGHEGSPCLPHVQADVARPVWVDVAFLDKFGITVRQRFEGMWAVSVQHQIDHLAGRMYFDRLSRAKRDMLIRKSKKLGG